MDLAGRTSLTHVRRRRRVGRCEAMRGEDNVAVLKDVNVIFTAFHIFGCCCFSVATRGEDNVDVF